MIQQLSEILKSLITTLKSLTVEQIALISIFVSFIIYSLGKRNELRMKKHEAKKENYLKFIELHKDVFNQLSENKVLPQKKFKVDFFNVGSSLLSYGSKKIYRKYLFYREITNNPLVENSKYYEKDLNLYLLGNILVEIRKELTLEKKLEINENEALGFFVNGISNNPVSKKKLAKVKFEIRMLKLELFLIDRSQFVILTNIFYLFIAPIFAILLLLFKYLFLIPLGKVIISIYPKSKEWIKK